jgi:ATP-dependent Lon protease
MGGEVNPDEFRHGDFDSDVLDRACTKIVLLPMILADGLREEVDAKRLQRIEEENARNRSAHHLPVKPAASAVSKPPEDEEVFARIFERGVRGRDPTKRHPVLTSKEVVRVSRKIASMRDRESQKREWEVLDKLMSKGALRSVANPVFAPSAWEKSLHALLQCHPHFRAVTDYVATQVALSRTSKKPLVIPPLHIWGPPGIGKSCYAHELATALGTPIRRQSMENAQTTALLLGSERHWSTAAPGIVFEAIALGEHANPIFLIDELDKAPKNSGYDPVAPLHSLLEPFTAQRARDAALDFEFDASLAIYIATSNDPAKVPDSLRSRFREFQILPPRGEDALQAARVVVAQAVAELGIPGFVPPEARWAHKLAHLTPREICHVVRDAVARALQSGRLHLMLDDLPRDEGEEPPSRTLH